MIVEILQPFSLLVLLNLIGLVYVWRRRRHLTKGKLVWPTICFLLLCLICLPAVAFLISGTLEWNYPPVRSRPADIRAIIVLGGAVHEADVPGRPAELGVDSLYRCLAALQLYREGPKCLLIVSGGKVHPDQDAPAVAEAMRDFLTTAGVEPTDVVVENQSRNTFENAVRVAEILRQRKLDRVLLVTDAIHLRRSQWCFAAQGIDVIPSGVSYSASDFEWSIFQFMPNPKAANQVERVSHEWLGILWYWLRGRFQSV